MYNRTYGSYGGYSGYGGTSSYGSYGSYGGGGINSYNSTFVFSWFIQFECYICIFYWGINYMWPL